MPTLIHLLISGGVGNGGGGRFHRVCKSLGYKPNLVTICALAFNVNPVEV